MKIRITDIEIILILALMWLGIVLVNHGPVKRDERECLVWKEVK